MYILIVGNPVDGLEFYGLFDSPADAVDWAEENLTSSNNDWWIKELLPAE